MCRDISRRGGESCNLTPLVTRKAAMAYFWSNQVVAVWKAAGGDDRNLMLAPLQRVPECRSASRQELQHRDPVPREGVRGQGVFERQQPRQSPLPQQGQAEDGLDASAAHVLVLGKQAG